MWKGENFAGLRAAAEVAILGERKGLQKTVYHVEWEQYKLRRVWKEVQVKVVAAREGLVRKEVNAGLVL